MFSKGKTINENVALPSVDIFLDLPLVVNFCIGSQHDPDCDEEYPFVKFKQYNYSYYTTICYQRIDCYYNDSVPASNVTLTPHFGWATIMLFLFLLNYLICWYVWATTDKWKAVTWVAACLNCYPQYVACKTIWKI